MGAYNCADVVWHINFERGIHLLFRVTRSRILHYGYFVAELGRETYGCLDTRVCYQPDDDELIDTVFLKLQIQIGIGEATGTPVLLGHNVARLRCKFVADLPTPGPIFKSPVLPRCLLNR